MKSCLNATTLNQNVSFPDFVRLAGRAGFGGVEVRIGAAQELARDVGVEGVRRLFADAGVAPAHCGVSVGLQRAPAEYAEALKRVPGELELARALGIPTAMIVLPFRRDGGEPDPRRVVERVREVGDLAADYGVGITLEFIGLHPAADQRDDFPTTLGKTLDLVDQAGRRNVGALLDSYHWYLGGSRTADLARVRQGMPLFIHINDAPPGPVEQLTDPMRVLPGEGVLDLAGWLRDIRRATGYDGYASLELFNPQIRELDPEVAVKRSAEAVNQLLAAVA
jgi:sugar phosphate isomerase/epimerase